MDCCKEEKCCPCADRIECLQAQISQLKEMLTEVNDRLPHAGAVLVNILPEEELDKNVGILRDD